MSISEVYKIIILIIFACILLSLVWSAFFLTKDHGKEATRTVKLLTVRVTLSVILFCMLIFGYFTGLLRPHGLMLPANVPSQEQVQDHNSQ
ncbi:MAG: twin transmembrane helix small protein [Gammaproteobacteria bacterium]